MLEQRSDIKSLVAEKCKLCEIYWRICDVFRETYFSQKMFANRLNMFTTSSLNGKDIPWRENTDPKVKKKSQVQQSIKKVLLIVFQCMKGPISIDFLENGASVNSAFYCQLLWQNLLYSLKEPCFSFNIKG